MDTIRISDRVIDAIRENLRVPETGGILGIDEKRLVTKFYNDSTGITRKFRYIPDVQSLNAVIQNWAEVGIAFIGFVHTHRKGEEKLSPLDLEYAAKIKAQCSLSEILMLLYIPAEDKFFKYLL